MNIAFRVDSSQKIGTGHVFRCLALAQSLKAKGHETLFICRSLPEDATRLIEERGHKVARIEYQDSACNSKIEIPSVDWAKDAQLTIRELTQKIFHPDYLIVDHYGLEKQWEMSLSKTAKNIFVIDDLANRLHFCHVLLDQNYYVEYGSRYQSLVPAECTNLLGPQYALLPKAFSQLRNKTRRTFSGIHRICIFYGGSDPTNETLKVLEVVKALLEKNQKIEVIVGVANPNAAEIERKTSEISGASFHFNVSTKNMAEIFSSSDLSLGAAGTTTWERCCLGLPAFVTAVADNQVQISQDLEQYGAIRFLGKSDQVQAIDIYNALSQHLKNPGLLQSLSEKGSNLVDGMGLSRVVEYISLNSGEKHSSKIAR